MLEARPCAQLMDEGILYVATEPDLIQEAALSAYLITRLVKLCSQPYIVLRSIREDRLESTLKKVGGNNAHDRT